MTSTTINIFCKIINLSSICVYYCIIKKSSNICFLKNLFLNLHYNFEAIHNKDYSVVKLLRRENRFSILSLSFIHVAIHFDTLCFIDWLSRNLVGISINFSKSEEEELFINNASQRSSECLNLCIERFCSCV